MENAGIPDAKIGQQRGTVRFDTVGDMIATEHACVFTLGGILNETQFGRLGSEAGMAFQDFVTDSGTVEFTMPILTIQARKVA